MNLKDLNPKKVLIINVFGIGDVLFTTPFISNLKANLPDVSINYIGNQRTEPVLAGYKKIDKVFVYERDEYLDVYKRSKWEFYKKAKDFLTLIKKEQFDVVFDFSLNTSASIFTCLAGIKHRIGFNYKDRSPFLTHKVPFEGFERQHVVDYYLDLLESIGLSVYSRELENFIDQKDVAWAEDFLKRNGMTDQKTLIGVLPGAGASWGREARYRRWAAERYAKLVDKMIEKFAVQIILLGDKTEEDLCSEVLRKGHQGVISAFGQTDIRQLAALMAKCRLVVLNDGGPLHVAVAVKSKTVSIFGPVDDQVYGPYGLASDHRIVSKDLPCRPCYRRFRMTDCKHVSCLDIEVDDVFKRVEESL